MIWFGGRCVYDAAPVMIKDIVVGDVPLTPIRRRMALGFGEVYAGMCGGAREVTVRFGLPEGDTASLEALRTWAAGDAPKKLCLEGYEGRYLSAVLTAFPERHFQNLYQDYAMTFTAFDPYWVSEEERRVPCGERFFVGGNAPPLARIEADVPGGAAEWSDGARTMRFTGLPAGRVTVDLVRGTAFVGTESVMAGFDLLSDFIRIGTGWQRVTGAGNLFLRERWL